MLHNDGVRILLEVESAAADRILKVRKFRTRLLKSAKKEAQKEIEKYKRKLDAEFEAFQESYVAKHKSIEAKIEQKLKSIVMKMENNLESKKRTLVEEIVELVLDIKPQVHRNYRPPGNLSFTQKNRY